MIKVKKCFYYFLLLSIIVFNPNLFFSFPLISKKDNIHINNQTFQNNSQLLDRNVEVPSLNYSSLYYDWFNPKKDMIIILPNRINFSNSIQPLLEWKNKKGIKTIVLNNFSKYEGIDHSEKIRNLIYNFYKRENIKWVLLAADASEDLIPIRYVYNPDTIKYGDDEYNGYNNYYKPTDFYYADLTGSWDEDNDGNWGESSKYNSHGVDEIDWTPEVYVGRFPASNAEELEIMVNKTIIYEKNPTIGDWMNRMLLAGGISSYTPPEDETRLTTYIIQNHIQSEMNFTHLGEYTPSYTPPDPKTDLTQETFVNNFNNGYSTVFFAGHGNPYKFIRNPSSASAYTNLNANSSSNTNTPSLIYSFACTTSPYDQNDDNIGELLIKRKGSGAVGYIGGLRITWYFEDDHNLEKLNRGNAKLFWKEFYENKKFQQGRALYDSKVTYMNSAYFDNPSVSMDLEYERKNVLTYNLLGDPSLDIYTDIPSPVMNPFIEEVYEGQLVNIIVKNVQDNVIPNARVHLSTHDGIYRTFFTDDNGICNFTIPALGNKTYNVVVTGHNVVPSYFNFNTLLDEIEPEIYDLKINKKTFNRSEPIYFDVKARDSISGVEKVFIVISKDNFSNYNMYEMKNHSGGNNNQFECFVDDLEPGVYSYLSIARDYANNTAILYNKNYNFEIVNPLLNKRGQEDWFKKFIFAVLFSTLVGVISIFFINFHGSLKDYIKKYITHYVKEFIFL